MNSLPLIDVDRLQPGIYVVLDVGWRDHPFALNSFTLRTDQQVRQLQSLGPRQIRYCPERSSVAPLPEPVAGAAAPGPAETSTPAAAVAPAPDVRHPPQTALERQQAALEQVEAEYLQATRRHRLMLKHVLTEPLEARQAAEALSDTLLQSAPEGRELSVRLLTQRLGFQASGHEIGVAALALLLARDCGFAPDALRELTLAALLHDIGKLRTPAFLHEDHVKLTEFERATYRRHVELGVELARSLELPPAVLRAIAEHHERLDGTGFPSALSGQQVSPAGRVLAIVNRYLDLVCPLHVEAGLTPHLALQQMYRTEWSHFDQAFLSRFVRLLGIYPPGTLVELTDRRMAVVVATRPGMSLSPTVQLMDRPDHDETGPAIDLDPHSGPRVHCSLQPQQLNPRWGQRAQQLARSAFFLQPVATHEPAGQPLPEPIETVAS